MKAIVGLRTEQDIAAAKAFLESTTEFTDIMAVAVVPTQSRLPSVVGTAARLFQRNLNKLHELEKANATELLDDFKSSLQTSQLKVETTVSIGNPADEILKVAREKKADFIILTRRLGERQAAPRLGHVASRVSRYSSCSVILLDPSKATPKTILYATDGSKPAELAGAKLRSLGIKGTPSLMICTIAAPFRASFIRTGSFGYDEYQKLVTELHDEEKALARKILSKASGFFSSSNFKTQTLFYTGETADTLLQAIEEFNADLTVVGASGASSIERFFLGNVALKLLGRAPCSMLVARETHYE